MAAEITVLLIGKTGSGKSLLANTIMRLKPDDLTDYQFRVSDRHSSARMTVEPQAQTKTVHGVSLRVIDTPGFFDKEIEVRERWMDVLKAVKLAGHIDAVIIVVNVRELATGADCLTIAQDHIGNSLTNRFVIVFTHVANADKRTCEYYVKQFNGHLKSGVLGAKTVFSDQRGSEEENYEKMKEIVEHLKSITKISPSPIDISNLCTFTETYFKDKIKEMSDQCVTYEGLANRLDLNLELLLEFISKEKMQEMIDSFNANKKTSKCSLM